MWNHYFNLFNMVTIPNGSQSRGQFCILFLSRLIWNYKLKIVDRIIHLIFLNYLKLKFKKKTEENNNNNTVTVMRFWQDTALTQCVKYACMYIMMINSISLMVCFICFCLFDAINDFIYVSLKWNVIKIRN